MQKLILLPRDIHKDLHSAMSDERFYEKYKVDRDVLLYRRRKVDCGFWDKDGNYKEDIQEIRIDEE